MKTSRYMSYYCNGDRWAWEFFKYAVFSNYLFSYYGSKLMVRIIYPHTHKCVNSLADYYGDMFEVCYEFEYCTDSDVKYLSGKMEYLRKHVNSEDPIMYMGEDVAPTSKFDVDHDSIYFLDQSKTTPEFVKFYRSIGIYDKVYDDSLIFVPKQICNQVLDDVERIQTEFGFNDAMMDKILQLIIQTRAILLDIPIQVIGNKNFTKMSEDKMMFLGNGISSSF